MTVVPLARDDATWQRATPRSCSACIAASSRRAATTPASRPTRCAAASSTCCGAKSRSLAPARLQRLLAQLTDEVVGLGPLEPLLADPAVTEVMLNGPGRAYVERDGRIEPVALPLDAERIVRLVERVVAPLGLRLDRASPMVDARLPDGSRLHAVIPPLAIDGPYVTIRRFGARAVPLEAFGLGDAPSAFLGWAVIGGLEPPRRRRYRARARPPC